MSIITAEVSDTKRPPTRRQYVEREMDAVELLARERKLPYVEYLASLRKQHGTNAVVALLVKHCGPAHRMGELDKYVALEIQAQTDLAVKAGYTDLLKFRYKAEDIQQI